MAEVGNAQVAVFPVFTGFRNKMTSEVGNAGKAAGKQFGAAFKGATDLKIDTSKLNKAVGTAGASLAKARQQQATAAGKVRVAEAQLAEAIQKTGRNSSATVAAEEKLAAANRNLESTSERTEAAVKDLAQAQERLGSSSGKTAAAGRQAAGKYASGWAGIRQRISGHISGGITDGSSRASGRATSAGTSLGRKLGGSMKAGIVGMIATIAFDAVLGQFNDVVEGASDLNETVNKSKTIFGGSFSAIDKWANAASGKMGLSRKAALSAASAYGDMFKQIGFGKKQSTDMSKTVVQLAADLGSFNNLDTAEVSDMISASFRGEYDSLQRLVPTINAAKVQKLALAQTGKTTVDALTDEEKATATLTLIQKGAARAQGDFVKTSGDLANRQKIQAAQAENLSDKFGKMLIPIKQLALDGFAKMLEFGDKVNVFLQDNPKIMEGVIAGFQLAGDAVGGFAQVMGPVLGAAVITFATGFAGFTRSIAGFLGILSSIPGNPFPWAKDAETKLNKVADGADALAQGIADLGKQKAFPVIGVKDIATKATKKIDKQIKDLEGKKLTLSAEDKASGKAKDIDKTIKALRGKKLEIQAHVFKTGISRISVTLLKGGAAGALIGGSATGGLITGPGTSTSDSIPRMLSNREYVLRAAAVSKLGVKALDYMNKTGNMPSHAVPVASGGGSTYIAGNVYGDHYLAQINKRDATRARHEMERAGVMVA